MVVLVINQLDVRTDKPERDAPMADADDSLPDGARILGPPERNAKRSVSAK